MARYADYGRGDMVFERIKFDSFVELNNWRKENIPHGCTMRYDGNTTCGTVEIELSSSECSKKGEVLKKASELLKFL